jgi:hypothetical protein
MTPHQREFVEKMMAQQPGPFDPPELIKPQKWDEYTVRVFYDGSGGIVLRPKNDTFHSWCAEVLKKTFGQDWLDGQFALRAEQRHVVTKWLAELTELQTRHTPADYQPGDRHIATASGGAKHAILLGRDLFYLQRVERLPDWMIDRLRLRDQFQGAWYEVAVASALVLAGFEIDWLSKKSDSHCEFTGYHRFTKEKFAVEAKSKHRKGILNQPGDKPEELRTLAHRNFREALKKDPEGLPLAIFVDVNMPPTNTAEEAERQWGAHMRNAIQPHGQDASQPAKFAFVVCTNFTWHHRIHNPATEWSPPFVYRPPYSERPLGDQTLDGILIGVGRAGVIPAADL